MLIIENYEIAFSRDNSVDGAPEVVLLVLDKQDLPQEGFVPCAVRLVEDPEYDFPKIFVDGAPSTTDLTAPMFECPNVPVDTLRALEMFSKIWLCVVEEGQVVDEFLIPFAYEDHFEIEQNLD